MQASAARVTSPAASSALSVLRPGATARREASAPPLAISLILIDRTYAVGVCREAWRDRLPSGCPSKIASFWRVQATNVAETGQKGRSRGRLHCPRTPTAEVVSLNSAKL